MFCITQYKFPYRQEEITTFLLQLETDKEITEREFEGFLRAEIYLTKRLAERQVCRQERQDTCQCLHVFILSSLPAPDDTPLSTQYRTCP
jgi:hypothetical protein